MEHEPALLARVVEHLLPALERGGVVVDGTLGRAGHAAALLAAAPSAHLVGIDRDPEALRESRAHLAAYPGRWRLVRGEFSELPAILERLGVEAVRGVLLDLGVSSPQLDVASRGFSFRSDGPLDMRMDPHQGLSADDVVNGYDERELARVIRVYGEERFASRVARGIVRARPVESTQRLAEVVAESFPAAARRAKGHPARRTFQAIRIEVNDEIGTLERALPGVVDVLEPGGRAVIISYHSLEDRTVKRFFAQQSSGCTCPPDFPICTCGAQATLRVLTKRPVRPSQEETERNPRVRSARLRAAERVAPTPGADTQRARRPA